MIRNLYLCPTCRANYNNIKDAVRCRNRHEIKHITYLMCECGWGVRADRNANAEDEFQKHKKRCKYYD